MPMGAGLYDEEDWGAVRPVSEEELREIQAQAAALGVAAAEAMEKRAAAVFDAATYEKELAEVKQAQNERAVNQLITRAENALRVRKLEQEKTGAPALSDTPLYYLGASGRDVFDFIADQGLGFTAGCAVKYITRAGRKAEDPIPDLEKAIACLERAIELAKV